jgi:hypothetical protein
MAASSGPALSRTVLNFSPDGLLDTIGLVSNESQAVVEISPFPEPAVASLRNVNSLLLCLVFDLTSGTELDLYLDGPLHHRRLPIREQRHCDRSSTLLQSAGAYPWTQDCRCYSLVRAMVPRSASHTVPA